MRWLMYFLPVKNVFTEKVDESWYYGADPKGLLTFRGSLYEEVAKTTPGAHQKKILPSKNTVSST